MNFFEKVSTTPPVYDDVIIFEEPRLTLWKRLKARLWLWRALRSRLKNYSGPGVSVKSVPHSDDIVSVTPVRYFVKGFDCPEVMSETTLKLAAWLGEEGVRIDYMIDDFFERNPRIDFMKINAATHRHFYAG